MRRGRTFAIVDVGNEYIKVACVEARGGKPFLAGLRVVAMGVGGDPAGSLRSAFHDLKLRGVPVLGLVPRQFVNLRLLDLPSVDKTEIADMVDLQIGKQTPYSRDEIVSGHKRLSGSREGYSRLLLAIVQKSALRQRLQILEQADIETEAVSISTEGLLGWCDASLGDVIGGQTVAVLDVDTFCSEFLVLSDGQPVFTRSIMLGANALRGADGAAQMTLELQRSVEACQGELPGRALSRIVLTGAAGSVEGLAAAIAGKLSVPCETRDSLHGIRADSKLDRQADVSLAAIAGMAASGGRPAFDLLPDTILAKRLLLSKARNLSTLASFAAMALVSVSAYGTTRYLLARARLNSLRAEINRLQPEVRRLEGMQEIISVVKARHGTRFSPVPLLNELEKAIPEDTRIFGVDINYAEGRMTIQADSANTRLVRDFEEKLRESPVFKSAKERNTTRDAVTQRSVFEMGVELETGKMILDRIDRLGARERFGIGFAALAFCALVVDMAVVKPVARRIGAVQADVGRETARLAYCSVAVAERPSTEAAYEQVRGMIGKASSSDEATGQMIGEVDELAAQAGLVVARRAEQGTEKLSYCEEHAMEIAEFSAPLSQLLAFLYAIQDSPGMLRVTRLRFAPEKGTGLMKGYMEITKVVAPAPPGGGAN